MNIKKEDFSIEPKPRVIFSLFAICFAWFLPILIISVSLFILFRIETPELVILASPAILGYLTIVEMQYKKRTKKEKETFQVT